MKLNALFGDHTVLQANKPIRVFGEGSGTVSVSIAGRSKTLVSERDDWCVELEPQDYGGPYDMMVTLDGERQVFTDVYFGDVFILAGQSNLQFKLFESSCKQEDWEENPLLRFFMTERLEEGELLHPADGFVPCQRETMGMWSAVGYHMAEMLHADTGHAVGIIGCYQGASIIQSWIKGSLLEEVRSTHPSVTHVRGDVGYPWNEEGRLYDYQLLSIAPFSAKAVVWYQGESNAHGDDGLADNYLFLLKLLVENWRDALQDDGLPFIVIEMANFIHAVHPDYWGQVQAAQRRAAEAAPLVGCVSCKDVCEDDDIHPPTKEPLARRIIDYVEQYL